MPGSRTPYGNAVRALHVLSVASLILLAPVLLVQGRRVRRLTPRTTTM